MTFDNAKRDWLILALSWRRIPSLQVLRLSSLPEKTTYTTDIKGRHMKLL